MKAWLARLGWWLVYRFDPDYRSDYGPMEPVSREDLQTLIFDLMPNDTPFLRGGFSQKYAPENHNQRVE